MNSLDKSVLILNKNWIPINTTSVKHSFALMYVDNAKGLIIDNGNFISLDWNSWASLELRESDEIIKTVNGRIKIPNIIVLNNNDKIPRQTIKFTQKSLWERDNFTCQYTGKKLTKLTGNIDHVIPKSHGGKTCWENCVLAHKDINSKKANKTPEQAGLKLLKIPSKPRIMPVSFYIKRNKEIKDWNLFLI